MNSVGSKKIKFEKYQKFTPSDYKDIGIRNFMFVARVKFFNNILLAV